MAVSYTHLDVYKRQGITSFEMAPQFVSADDRTFLDSVIQNGYAFTDRYDLATVSYTHLDVYKRQQLYFENFCSSKPCLSKIA